MKPLLRALAVVSLAALALFALALVNASTARAQGPQTRKGPYPTFGTIERNDRRFDRLVPLQKRISLEKNQALVGERLEVLVEGEGRKGNLKTRTRTNKLVHVTGDLQPGQFAEALITGAHPHHLDGRLHATDPQEPELVAVS